MRLGSSGSSCSCYSIAVTRFAILGLCRKNANFLGLQMVNIEIFNPCHYLFLLNQTITRKHTIKTVTQRQHLEMKNVDFSETSNKKFIIASITRTDANIFVSNRKLIVSLFIARLFTRLFSFPYQMLETHTPLQLMLGRLTRFTRGTPSILFHPPTHSDLQTNNFFCSRFWRYVSIGFFLLSSNSSAACPSIHIKKKRNSKNSTRSGCQLSGWEGQKTL